MAFCALSEAKGMDIKMENSVEYESIPNAYLLLSSLRSMGYTEETAIADIIDNSITAGATRININFEWKNQRIVISDNGEGMGEQELLNAMKIGSANPNLVRSENDLGRFGLGMKTASFSVGKRLIVATKVEQKISNACWDLDEVEKQNAWKIIILDEKDSTYSVCKEILEQLNSGTIVVIQQLDKIIDNNNLEKSKNKYYHIIKKVKRHVSLVFHRFIEEDGLQIFVNGNLIEAWNPFVINNSATQELSSEEYYEGDKCISIQPYVLPHKTKFSSIEEYKNAGGIKGWYQHQGFYIYRNRRLLVYGTWFGVLKKEIAFNLARIKIDINADSDFDWKIDIKKSKATPPVYIEELIEKIAYLTTERSACVYNSRGTYRKNSKNNMNVNLSSVWEQRKSANGKYSFKLNKKHPLLFEVENTLKENEKEVLQAYLSLVENLSPVMLSGVVDTIHSDKGKFEQIKKEYEKEILHLKRLIGIFKKQEFDNAEILDTLLDMECYRGWSDVINELLQETSYEKSSLNS